MTDELRLDGRVAIVTGAGRGIGRAHALLLAARGATVVVNDLGCSRMGTRTEPEHAAGVVAEIVATGGAAVANLDDVSTPAGADAVVDQTLTEYGQVDILVNNAGMAPYRARPFIETTLETFGRQWEAHFGGTYNMTRSVWPLMTAARSGRIVNTCSTAGLYGMPGVPEYAAAKGAVQAFTYSLRDEAASFGIAVNGIGPGGYTRMVWDFIPDPDAAAAAKAVLRPELCAPLIVWLAHESCESNGAIYEAHGGRIARVAIGEPEGYWNLEMTPEAVRDNRAVFDSDKDLVFPTDAIMWAGWVVEHALGRAAPAG